MLALALGVMPASQCASISLWNKCCCAVEEKPAEASTCSCCAAKKSSAPHDHLSTTNTTHGCLMLPSQALADNQTAQQALAHLDTVLPPIEIVLVDVPAARPARIAEVWHPPDTPLFVLVRSLLI
jgi:hypothetical protein